MHYGCYMTTCTYLYLNDRTISLMCGKNNSQIALILVTLLLIAMQATNSIRRGYSVTLGLGYFFNMCECNHGNLMTQI